MTTEEQSSTSVTKKIITPNKKLVGLKKSEEQKEVTNEKAKLPQPTGWRMLVLPFKMNEKTKAELEAFYPAGRDPKESYTELARLDK